MAVGGSASSMKTQLVSAIQLQDVEEEEERETAAAKPVQEAKGNYF